MYLKQIIYLRLVVEHGSFAAAARAAGVSQPAITLAMQTLERAWGVPLFEKTGRQKLPTHIAVQAAQRAADLQTTLDGLARGPSQPVGWTPAPGVRRLRTGMAHAAALLYGPTIEQAWHAHHGDGLLQIMWGSGPELLAALQVHELDLVIAPRPRRYQASGIRRHTLHTSTPTVHARVGHPLAAATSLDAIRHAGWAVAGRAGTAGNVIEEAHRVRGLPDPRILVQCGDYPTMLNLVARSDLLCVVPHPALLPVQDAPTVQALHLREGLPQYDVCLFWRARRRGQDGDAAVSAVVAALKALAADGGTATGTDAPGGRPG
jgi:DNA-binding transcriptional LysR family regulator